MWVFRVSRVVLGWDVGVCVQNDAAKGGFTGIRRLFACLPDFFGGFGVYSLVLRASDWREGYLRGMDAVRRAFRRNSREEGTARAAERSRRVARIPPAFGVDVRRGSSADPFPTRAKRGLGMDLPTERVERSRAMPTTTSSRSDPEPARKAREAQGSGGC